MGFRIPSPKDPTDSYLAMLQNDTEEQRADARAAAQSNVAYNEALGQAPTNAINAWRQGRSFAEETNNWDRNAGRYKMEQEKFPLTQQLTQKQINQTELANKEAQANQEILDRPVTGGPTLREQSVVMQNITAPQNQQKYQAGSLGVSQGQLGLENKKYIEDVNQARIKEVTDAHNAAANASYTTGQQYNPDDVTKRLASTNRYTPEQLATGAQQGGHMDPAKVQLAQSLMKDSAIKYTKDSSTYFTAVKRLNDAVESFNQNTGDITESDLSKGVLKEVSAALKQIPGMEQAADTMDADLGTRLWRSIAGANKSAKLKQLLTQYVGEAQQKAIRDLESTRFSIPENQSHLPDVLKADQMLSGLKSIQPAAKRLENLNAPGGQTQITPAGLQSGAGGLKTSDFRTTPAQAPTQSTQEKPSWYEQQQSEFQKNHPAAGKYVVPAKKKAKAAEESK